MFDHVNVPARRMASDAHMLKGQAPETDQLRHLRRVIDRVRVRVVRVAHGVETEIAHAENDEHWIVRSSGPIDVAYIR